MFSNQLDSITLKRTSLKSLTLMTMRSDPHINSQMEPNILENGQKVISNDKEEACRYGLMGLDMMGISRMGRQMDLEDSFTVMEMCMRAYG